MTTRNDNPKFRLVWLNDSRDINETPIRANYEALKHGINFSFSAYNLTESGIVDESNPNWLKEELEIAQAEERHLFICQITQERLTTFNNLNACIRTAIQKFSHTKSISYLGTTLDQCSQREKIETADITLLDFHRFYRTYSPIGWSGVIIWREAIPIILTKLIRSGQRLMPSLELNQLVENRQLEAQVISPPALGFNLSLAINDLQYLRKQECRVRPTITYSEEGHDSLFFYFLIVLTLSFLLAWLLTWWLSPSISPVSSTPLPPASLALAPAISTFHGTSQS